MVSKNEILSLIAQLNTQGDIQAEKTIQKITKIGKTTIPYLIEAAKNEEFPRVMKWSLLALGAIGDKKGIPLNRTTIFHNPILIKKISKKL